MVLEVVGYCGRPWRQDDGIRQATQDRQPLRHAGVLAAVSAGEPHPASHPIGIRVSGGTMQPMWTAPPSATLLARPMCAPLKTMAPVAMNTSSPITQPVRCECGPART